MAFYQKNNRTDVWEQIPETVVLAIMTKHYDFSTPAIIEMLNGETLCTPDGQFKWEHDLPESFQEAAVKTLEKTFRVHPVFESILYNIEHCMGLIDKYRSI